jgi:MFS family permease
MKLVPLSLVMLVLIGWAFMTVTNISNALIQLRVTDAIRGRVMGLYTLVFFGAMPVGTLLLGSLADRFNEPLVLWISALALAIFFTFIWLRFPEVRKLE